jgi:hypothetical protein
MQGRVPFVVALSNGFIDSSGRLHPLAPLNAATSAGGGTEGKGACNDKAWMRKAQFDLCDVSGCCCDEINRTLPGDRVVIDRSLPVDRLKARTGPIPGP